MELKSDESTFYYRKTIDSEFTLSTAGGCSSHRTFLHNPQFRLTVRSTLPDKRPNRREHGQIWVETSRDTPINAKIVWGSGQRVSNIRLGDIRFDTGPYSYGAAAIRGRILPGVYTIIISTFEPGKCAPFMLEFECTLPFTLEPIPAEGAGSFSKVVRGFWHKETAGGSISLGKYDCNPKYRFKIAEHSRVNSRLQIWNAPEGATCNVTIFGLGGDGQLLDQVASSGSYSGAICGVTTGPTPLKGPGIYEVVVSTFEPHEGAAFELCLYSSKCAIDLMPNLSTYTNEITDR